MLPATRSVRALAAALVAVLVACGVTLAGAPAAVAAPSRVTQEQRAVPEPHAVTPHASRVGVVTTRHADGPRHDDTGPLAVLGVVAGAAPTDVVPLTEGARAPPHRHHLAPTSARAPPA